MASANHPMQVNRFQVDAGFSRVGFTRVLLPRIERDVVRYREGASKDDAVRLLPGLLKYGECTLERGLVAADNEFFKWMQTVQIGVAERRDITVRLLDEQFNPVAAWQLRNTFPVLLEWSMLDAHSSTVLIETLRLAVEGVQVQIDS
jgi:phage tail-like protein